MIDNGKSILETLASVGGEVGALIEIGGKLIPIGIAVIKKIKTNIAGVETESFQLLVASDQAILLDVDRMSNEDLDAINAEFKRLGYPLHPRV